jgi:ABC-type microcin C transport system permease subunit YejB
MKLNSAVIVGVVCAVVAVVLFASVALQQSFPVFGASQAAGSVSVDGNIGAEDSRFLWNNTGLAVTAQAFVLFAAAAATLGLLKNGEENKDA